MSFLTVLPLAIVMVAGPQILSAVFLATTENWKQNSLGFLVGAAISISLAVTTGYVLGNLITLPEIAGGQTLSSIIVVLLLLAMISTYLSREQSEPPEWMGKLGNADSLTSFKLGFFLLGFFPTDIATSLAVGSYLSSQGEPLYSSAVFVGTTVLLLGLPLIGLLLLGERGERLLPGIRDWMNRNSWIVNEAVILIFLAIILL